MLTFRSWTEAHENLTPLRLIEVNLNGFFMSLNKETASKDNFVNRLLMDKLDFQVDLEISDTFTTVNCALSAVVIRLSYLDYLSMKSIAYHNLGKINNKQQWDNLERAWARESNEVDIQDESDAMSTEVAYSSSARVIRYGQCKGTEKKVTPIKAVIKLASVGLVLRRDDSAHIAGSSYDMIGISGEGFECDLGIKEDGEHWLHLSLNKILVVDLGRMGRLLRSNHLSMAPPDLQRAESLGILVSGYNSTSLHKSDESDVIDSQLVFKAEKEASTGNVNLVIIISFISVTAFVEPIQDLISFVTCKWIESSIAKTATSNLLSMKENPNADVSAKLKRRWTSSIRSKISIRFVSHYARFIFAADELDYQSRCLIVQG